MSSGWPKNPLIYESNTWTWLHDLSEKYDRRITLGTVPDKELDEIANWHIDVVWLMGVWERSAAGRQIAVEHPDLHAEYHRTLPDYAPEDVVGSPFAIHRYAVDPHLGDRDELAALRAELAARGLRLMLDFVPNHVAPDHPWLAACLPCFIQGDWADLEERPNSYFLGPDENHVFANGRDPYFPAWTDTAQLNAFSPDLRQRATDTLLDIAAQCDGVRCDMAMLMTTRVFAQTWGQQAGPVPDREFWEVIIPAVKQAHHEFKFMAEVYWDMEWELQQQGFDYTYDKRLYDRLEGVAVDAVRAHLHAALGYQEQLVRFIENHDEPRAAEALGFGRDLAAAVLITTLPGAKLLHEGQFAAHQVKLPVQLGRRPHEDDNPDTVNFYRRLLREASQDIYRYGHWQLRQIVSAWATNQTHANLIGYTWQYGQERRLVVVNLSHVSSQGWINLPNFGLEGGSWVLQDILHSINYERDGDEMVDHGLYIDLEPWWTHIFNFR
jgi:glycosidase